MSYRLYNIEDFVNDRSFRNWVLVPNEERNYFWERWIIENPDKKEIIEQAILIVKNIQFEETSFSGNEKEKLLKRIEQTIANNEKEGRDANHIPSKLKIIYQYVDRIAAIWVGFILLASFWLVHFNNRIKDEVVFSEVVIEKEVSKGQKMKIFLPDGSVVYLNSSSKIVYPEKFLNGTREIELLGEAFFEVAKDSLHPFIVKSGGLLTKVYGTSFNILSYPDSDVTSVSLVSGKVTVEKDGSDESISINPGEAVDLNRITGELTKTDFDFNKVVLWKDGILYFKESSITDIFKKLEQWYGVTFHINNIPSNLKPINGRFENESLRNVLLSLGHAVNFDYTIDANDVFVQFK